MANFTKKAIKECFVELLDEYPISQITVKKIIEKCGINRNTFYYHFDDIPSLVEEIATDEADKIISECESIESFEMAFYAAIDFAENNRRAIFHIFNSANRDIFERSLWNVIKYVITTASDNFFSDKSLNSDDRVLIEEYYQSQCFGMVMHWLQNGMNENVRGKIKRIFELQKGTIEETVNRIK